MADTVLFHDLIEKFPIFNYHVTLIHFRVVLIHYHLVFIHFRVTFTFIPRMSREPNTAVIGIKRPG
jgi:hypothetical protein